MSAAGSSAAEVSAAKPSAADRNLLKFFSDGHFLSGQLRQFAAESARIRADSGGVRRSPPNVRRTFGGVRQKIVLAEVQRIRADPGGVRAYPRGSARVRGGRTSADGKALNWPKIVKKLGEGSDDHDFSNI